MENKRKIWYFIGTMAKKTHAKTADRKNAPIHHPDFFGSEFNLPDTEERVLAFWDERHVFEKSLAKRKGAKEFVFYEGPPYANGKPGIHHVLSRVVKDAVLRYKTMQGYHVPRRAGWDTHGLPVEMAAEKALGFRTKRDIEQFGVKKFNEAAKEQVWIYKDEWERMTRRIGYWLDLKNAYITYAPEYVESVWWTMSAIAKRNLLYKGHKVVPWCTRCGTALSSHELAQGYQEVTDTSVYVKFRLKPGQKIGDHVIKADDKIYILSWTTTPWTLPGNVALAVGPKIQYHAVEMNGEYLIAATDRLKDLGLENGQVFRKLMGEQLVGLEYEPLFEVAKLQSLKSYRVYPASFVTTTDGTGVVHTAVMYGEDDYALGKKEGLPEHHTVDEEGKFTKDVPALAGMYAKAKDTEAAILAHLESRGNLLRTALYKHEYPFCWRCGTAVLYYARTSWFIAMSKLRKELLANNATVNWMPAHVKSGRFGEWLKEAKDWNLSRERYWGAPLPIWECRECGHKEVAESMDALSRLAGGSRNRYWVMRHGEAESNVFDVLDSGQRNYLKLTPRGRKEAERSAKAFAATLKKKHEKIDLIIHSDIERTSETAEIAMKALGVSAKDYTADARLEEIHLGPALTGRRDEQYREFFPTLESRFEKRPEGGESVRDLRARMRKFFEDCEKAHEGRNILLVSHEYPIWAMFQTAEGWSEKRAIHEMEKRAAAPDNKKGDFIGFAEVRPLELKTIPRNDTGEVDLHRPFVDDITFACAECRAHGKAGTMKRVKEVADVWYDSGAMPYGQVHFPFEGNAKLAQIPYPADYIAEGMDQTRGWFYTLMAIATALGYKAPYRNVITFGLINDKFGKKMSKSKGNIVEPFSVIDKFGVDAVRWYFYTGSPFSEPKSFDEQSIAQAFRRTHLIVYNSFVFWKTYADHAARLSPSVMTGTAKPKNVLDRWILARLAETAASVTAKLDRYEIREAALELEVLVDDLSRWYIRRSRRRLQKPSDAADYKAASATLRHALLSVATMMAPFTPFFGDALYAALGGAKESVHLDAWPKAPKTIPAASKKLIKEMALVRESAAAGLAKRAEAAIKVRQPLASITVNAKLGKELETILAEEVNVKQVIVSAKAKEPVLDAVITPELREEGLLREVVRMFQELRQKASLAPKDRIVAMLSLPEAVREAVSRNERTFMGEVGAAKAEYARSEKFQAESSAKMDGSDAWIGLRKI